MVYLHDVKRFNLMEFIFETIKESSYDQSRSSPYAPFHHRFINHVATSHKFKMDRVHIGYKPRKELQDLLPRKLNLAKILMKMALQGKLLLHHLQIRKNSPNLLIRSSCSGCAEIKISYTRESMTMSKHKSTSKLTIRA